MDIRENYAAEYTFLSAETVEVYFRMLEKAGLKQIRRPWGHVATDPGAIASICIDFKMMRC